MAKLLEHGSKRASRLVPSSPAALAPVVRKAAAIATMLGSRAGSAVIDVLDRGYRPDAGARPGGDSGIDIRDLRVAYGRRTALDGLTGTFSPASLTAVVGPNGAGKSSLLKALAGVLKPRSGKIVSGALTEGRFAYLPQQAQLDRDYPVTVEELVALGAWRSFGAFRRPPETVAAAVAEAIAAVGLEGLAGQPIAELSAGQFQRALFARIELQDAAVILLDEPFAAVDEATAGELVRRVKGWHQERRTVVAVLHDIEQVQAHFPATLLLARGVIAWGETATVLTAENLSRAHRAMQADGHRRVLQTRSPLTP